MREMTARAEPLRSESFAAVAGAGALAAILLWLGPQGTDLAAHAYQRALYLQHGFVLWNNFWYAGRYSFVNYSVLYYPLAALVGIGLLSVLTVALANSCVHLTEIIEQFQLVPREFACFDGLSPKHPSDEVDVVCAARNPHL